MSNVQEQEFIRFNCLNWISKTLSLLIEEKLELIESNPCPRDMCSVCNNSEEYPFSEEYPLRPLIAYSKNNDISYIKKVVERIYGIQSSDWWFKIIINNVPSFTKIKYFIENDFIDVNNGSYNYTLLSIHLNRSYGNYWREKLDYLLSEKVGYNINIQNRNGDNCLLSFIRCRFIRNRFRLDYINYTEDQLLQSYEKIIYLLENGADPLLEDKEGVCTLEFLKNLMPNEGFTQHKKQELIQLVERYV